MPPVLPGKFIIAIPLIQTYKFRMSSHLSKSLPRLSLRCRSGRRHVPSLGSSIQHYLGNSNTSAILQQQLQQQRRAFADAVEKKQFDDDRDMNTPLPNNSPEAESLIDRSEKGFLQRLFEKYSISKQTNRILVAESLLRAAIKQASDP